MQEITVMESRRPGQNEPPDARRTGASGRPLPYSREGLAGQQTVLSAGALPSTQVAVHGVADAVVGRGRRRCGPRPPRSAARRCPSCLRSARAHSREWPGPRWCRSRRSAAEPVYSTGAGVRTLLYGQSLQLLPP